MFIYSDRAEPKNGAIAPYETWKATERYLEHYGNLLFLQAIVNAPKDQGERRQALGEITICEKKLRFWERHINFDKDRAQKGSEELKRQWQRSR